MKRWLASPILATLLVSKAWAQTPLPADPWNTPHPAPPPAGQMQQPPPPYAPAPPYPPPAAYGAPGGYGWGPYGFNPQAVFMYENDKKSVGTALLLNFLLPGVGSIYADHATGALMAWALILGGAAVMVWGINQDRNEGSDMVNPAPLIAGYVMVLGGIVYSYVDAYQSAKAYNRVLAKRLGLPEGLVLAPARMPTGQATAWGPSLTFRF